jgi:hypothetical protein
MFFSLILFLFLYFVCNFLFYVPFVLGYAYEHLSFYTSMPHIAGSHEDLKMAQFTLQQFKEFGLNDSWIDEHKVNKNGKKREQINQNEE